MTRTTLPAHMIAAGHDPADWPISRTATEITKAALCATQHCYSHAATGEVYADVNAFAIGTEIPADMVAPAFASYLRQLPIARTRIKPAKKTRKSS